MNVLLQKPTGVVVLSRANDAADDVRSALVDSEADPVVSVSDVDGALDVVADDPVGCVVVDESVPAVESAHAAISDADESLPVVFFSADADRDLLSRLSRYDAATSLLKPVSDETLREVVEESLDRYHRTRVAAEQSDILDAFMSEVETPIFVKDAAGRHPRMTEVPGGVDEDVVIGKTDLEVYGYDPEAAAAFYADDMRVIEDDVVIRQKDEASGPIGNRHWARVNKVPWPGEDGSNKGLLGLSVDVTDLKEAEQRAEQLRERLEQFAGYVSHDLQNPLNVASGHLELARETGDEAALESVADALERIDEMVNDLNHLARRPPRGGLAEFVEIPFTVRQVWSFIRTEDATLEVETSETARVHATSAEMRPLLENLLRNAVVHGGPGVTVRVGTLEDGFYVADDGTGIPPGEREAVLQRGYTTSEEGSGTGLAIVSEIVERNNWSLEITESEEGGARFEFRGALVVPEPELRREPVRALALEGNASVVDGDVGGSADYDPATDTWTVTGDTDVDTQARAYYAVCAESEGPVRIEARLRDVAHVNDFSSAGVLVRDGLAASDAYGFLGRTVGRGTELVYRPENDGETVRPVVGDGTVHEWYRIDRVGETLTGFVSADGEDWEVLDQRTVAVSDPVALGIAVYSAVPGEPCEATFSSVSAFELE